MTTTESWLSVGDFTNNHSTFWFSPYDFCDEMYEDADDSSSLNYSPPKVSVKPMERPEFQDPFAEEEEDINCSRISIHECNTMAEDIFAKLVKKHGPFAFIAESTNSEDYKAYAMLALTTEAFVLTWLKLDADGYDVLSLFIREHDVLHFCTQKDLTKFSTTMEIALDLEPEHRTEKPAPVVNKQRKAVVSDEVKNTHMRQNAIDKIEMLHKQLALTSDANKREAIIHKIKNCESHL